MKKLFLILLSFIFLIGCQKDSFIIDFPYMKNIDHIYKKIDFNEAYDFFDNGTGVILLVYNSNQYACPYCKICLPIINEVGKANDIDIIYYLDIYNMRTNNTQEYQNLLLLISSQVDDLVNRNNQVILAVPDLYFIKNGKIIKHHIATIYDSLENKYLTELTEEDKETLKGIYETGFNLIK